MQRIKLPKMPVSKEYAALSCQKPLPGGNRLRPDIFRRRSAITVAAAHRFVHAEHVEYRLTDTFVDPRQFSQGQTLGGLTIAELRDQGRR